MININSISKSYKNGKQTVPALREVSFSVKKGELFGLIGPDGAGKTSLLRILTTLLLPDSGTATLNGFDTIKDYKSIRKITGYMPGKFSLYQDLSVEENLEFFATIFKTTIQANYHLIKDIYGQIEPFKTRKAGKLSGGMKQKLALSCALIHRPEILLLDEPTTGVDVVSRKEFWQMLQRLKEQGLTILVATPYMDEAMLCDRVALMQDGRILDIDTPNHLIEKNEKHILAVKSPDMYNLLLTLRQCEAVESAFLFGEYYHVTLAKEARNNFDLLQWLAGKNQQQAEIKSIRPGIEDIFMNLMQNHTHAT
jgi:ABC-type multidrug transport system ATPase subunit